MYLKDKRKLYLKILCFGILRLMGSETSDRENPEIFVVDFGSQTANLIGRRLKRLGASVEIIDSEDAQPKINSLKPKGLVLSGSPYSVYETGAPTLPPEIYHRGIPILGICYGWQDMAQSLRGEVERGSGEYGPENFRVKDHNSKLLDLPKKEFSVYMSHGDTVTQLPEGFQVIGSTAQVENTAVADLSRKLFGLQFHPEASHTQFGTEILRNFAAKICNANLSPKDLSPEIIIERIKSQAGKNKVICGVSGGVDSTVAAFLIGQAIGENLIPVYVDSGLMRPGTREHVEHIFTDLIRSNLVAINARDQFLSALEGVVDPEEKRKLIGKLYADTFKKEAHKHSDATFLGQGTIYSDVIESKGSKHASSIKSHHNVGGLPKDLGLELIEPVRDYYKDEVRDIGRLAGLPEAIIMQHPFPGPGYAIRIRGEVTRERLAQVVQADQIVIDEITKAGLYDQVFQCFAVMTGAYSTAVKGDARAFAEVVAIRAYESDDVMTSDWANLPRAVIQRMSSRIVNEVPNVSRVVYDVTSKPPATMEWE